MIIQLFTGEQFALSGTTADEFLRTEYPGIQFDLIFTDDICKAIPHLAGGGKKRKKKVFKTPKKIPHKHRKVKLPTLLHYSLTGESDVTCNRKYCENSTCGQGIMMAKHFNRHSCGRCGTSIEIN